MNVLQHKRFTDRDWRKKRVKTEDFRNDLIFRTAQFRVVRNAKVLQKNLN